MSTGSVLEETPTTALDEFSEEWLRDLRSILGRKQKRASLSSVRFGKSLKIGVQREEKSKTTDRFTAHYRESRKRLEELKLYGHDVSKFETEFNELVSESRTVMEQDVDMSGSKDTRKKNIRKIDDKFVDLNKRLKTVEKKNKSESKDIPWFRSQTLCGNKLKEYTRSWAPDDDALAVRRIFDVAVKESGEIEKSQRTKRGEEFKGKFTNLHKLINEKIEAAKTAKKEYEEEVKRTNERLKAMEQFWPQDEVEKEAENLRRALGKLSRRDYVAAKKKAVEAGDAILKRISTGQTKKRDFEEQRETAKEQLKKLAEAAMSKNMQLDAVEEVRRASQLADDGHDYVAAMEALKNFVSNSKLALKSYLTAKSKLETDWKSQLEEAVQDATTRYPEAFYKASVDELYKRIDRIEFIVDRTGDLHRAAEDLQETFDWFFDLANSWKVSDTDEDEDTDSEDHVLKKRREYLKEYRSTRTKINAVEQLMKQPAKLLHNELAALGIDEASIATEVELLQAYDKATKAFKSLGVEAQKLIDSEGELSEQKKKEDAHTQLLQLQKSHAEQLRSSEKLLSELTDQITPETDLQTTIAREAKAGQSDADALKESLKQLNTLQEQMKTKLKNISAKGGPLETARKNLKTAYENLHKAYKDTVKRFGGDQTKIYDSLYKSGEAIVGFVVNSTSVPAIEEAQEQVERVIKRFTEIGKGGTEFEAMNSNIDAWKNQRKKVKKHKDFRKFFKEEYDELLNEFDELHDAILKATSSERAARWINTLVTKSAIAFSDAEKARTAYDSMKKNLESVSGMLSMFSEVGVFDTSYHDRHAELKGILKKQNPLAILANEPKSASLQREVAELYRRDYRDGGGSRILLREQHRRFRESVVEEKKNERRRQEWEGQLNLLRNSEWESAKKAVSEDPNGDSKGIQIIRKQIHEAEKLGRKFKFDEAFNRLEVIRAQCLKLTRSPSGGNSGGKLKDLKDAWPSTVKALAQSVVDLQKAVKTAAEKPEWSKYKKLLDDELPEPLKSFEPKVFEPIIGTMCDSKSSSRARLRAREEGLAYVQTFLRRLQDPLLQAMIRNQFKVSVPAGELYRKLSALEYNLKTSR